MIDKGNVIATTGGKWGKKLVLSRIVPLFKGRENHIVKAS